ncbi:hypothetical protein J8273_2341 [Carpediemonas membranifera]|uniref:Uncharacterized protein n=1 Tax=Carpediemonas membranifera TaxID=201153 RepID=A0A8J6E5M7_9EUKA|nr:hypothetical protein J8273_2341 [Carpediemonas membranifera]|eukprot:KAG9395992.1 hypothetical protein J8273_2341 [Carpediemonas membranifera]
MRHGYPMAQIVRILRDCFNGSNGDIVFQSPKAPLLASELEYSHRGDQESVRYVTMIANNYVDTIQRNKTSVPQHIRPLVALELDSALERVLNAPLALKDIRTACASISHQLFEINLTLNRLGSGGVLPPTSLARSIAAVEQEPFWNAVDLWLTKGTVDTFLPVLDDQSASWRTRFKSKGAWPVHRETATAIVECGRDVAFLRHQCGVTTDLKAAIPATDLPTLAKADILEARVRALGQEASRAAASTLEAWIQTVFSVERRCTLSDAIWALDIVHVHLGQHSYSGLRDAMYDTNQRCAGPTMALVVGEDELLDATPTWTIAWEVPENVPPAVRQIEAEARPHLTAIFDLCRSAMAEFVEIREIRRDLVRICRRIPRHRLSRAAAVVHGVETVLSAAWRDLGARLDSHRSAFVRQMRLTTGVDDLLNRLNSHFTVQHSTCEAHWQSLTAVTDFIERFKEQLTKEMSRLDKALDQSPAALYHKSDWAEKASTDAEIAAIADSLTDLIVSANTSFTTAFIEYCQARGVPFGLEEYMARLRGDGMEISFV